MQVVLFDTPERDSLYPFTEIRPVAGIRTGILTIRERWELLLQQPASVLTESYLAALYPAVTGANLLYIDARLMPTEQLIHAIQTLKPNQALLHNQQLLAVRWDEVLSFGFTVNELNGVQQIPFSSDIQLLRFPFEISLWNEQFIKADFKLITAGRSSQPVSSTNQVIAPENVFIEEGAVVECAVINASGGPVYIGKNSLVMEGSLIRGPFAMLEKSVVKMGSKIYGATTAGKQCTIGGEIKNVVFFDYSNKAHDGYMGDAVIGEWCNIGAGTSCSNIKNTAGEVKVWNQRQRQWIAAGMKCGVLMGDFTRTAINTSLNTGTVTGICSNLIKHGFLPKYIRDFTWNTSTEERYVLEKALKDIANWMQLKQQHLSEELSSVITDLYSKQS